MVKKMKKKHADDSSTPPDSGALKGSAQQIWLAGLGAFAKAQEEGGRVFESLVKEGLSIQRKTHAVAEEKIAEATNKMTAMATDIQSKAGHQWDKLETIFEARVAKALSKLGAPTAEDMGALTARLDELTKQLQKMNVKPLAAKKAAIPAIKPVASKSPTAKRPASKSAAAAKTV